MEFDKSRIYSPVNADELKPGDKVIVADDLDTLKRCVKENDGVDTLYKVEDETDQYRFRVIAGGCEVAFALAYLVERKENCTNCIENDRGCTAMGNDKLAHCWNWKPITKQKAEKHYRPFRDTDELIKVWNKKFYLDFKPSHDPLTMPLIWVKRKECNCKGQLITKFSDPLWVIMNTEGYNMTDLFEHFTFLDGSPCGVEE